MAQEKIQGPNSTIPARTRYLETKLQINWTIVNILLSSGRTAVPRNAMWPPRCLKQNIRPRFPAQTKMETPFFTAQGSRYNSTNHQSRSKEFVVWFSIYWSSRCNTLENSRFLEWLTIQYSCKWHWNIWPTSRKYIIKPRGVQRYVVLKALLFYYTSWIRYRTLLSSQSRLDQWAHLYSELLT